MRLPSVNSTAATRPSPPLTMLRTRLCDDVHPGVAQGIEFGSVRVHAVVQHHCQPGAQLAEQPGGVEPHRVGDDLHDALVADLETVAERTVDDITAPVLRQAVDLRQLVDQPGRGKHPPSDDRMATDEFGAEPAVIGAGDTAARPLTTSPPYLRTSSRPIADSSDGGSPSHPR